MLGEGVEIGERAEIGANVVIHPGTSIGVDCVIQDGAVIGKPPKLGPASSAPRDPVAPARLGDGVAVLAGAVVFAGAELSRGVLVGDQAYVRERARIGEGSLIGRGTAVDNDVAIGARVKVQTNCYLTAGTVVEDDVFIGPGVTTTNDDTMERHPPEAEIRGPMFRRACRVGGGVVIRPTVELGEEAFVAAGAVVIADVPPRTVVAGVPAAFLRKIPDEDLLDRWR
jgi:acetyltransferase-like isoleucine patch superfamily enzyme